MTDIGRIRNAGDIGAAPDRDTTGFGRQLREYRERADLSLADFAQVMHYSPSYLSRIETGKRHPTETIAWECDRALGANGALGALVPASRPRGGGPGDLSRTVRLAAPLAAGRGAPGADRGPPVSGHGAEYDAMLVRGDSLYAAGKMRMARQSFQAAFGLGQGAPRAQAEAVIRMARLWSDPGQQDREGIARIRAALDSLAGDDAGDALLLKLRLQAHLARKLSFAISQNTASPQSRPDEGAVLARRTLAELPAGAPADVRCEVLLECRMGLFDSDPAADLVAISGQVEDVALRAGSSQLVSDGLVALAIDELRVGRLSSALATVWRHRVHAAGAGSALARWFQCVLDTLLDLWRGNFQAAEDWVFGDARAIVEASEAELEISADALGQTYLGQCFWLLREQGRLAQLLGSPMLQRVESHAFAPIWRAGLTLALCETGNWTDAADQVAAFADETAQFQDLPPSGWAVPTLTVFGEVCAQLHAHGDHRDLAAALSPAIDERLAAHDGEIALAGWPTVLVGPVARVRGLLAFAAGDAALGLERLSRAARLVRTSPPHMARLRADRARMLLGAPELSGAPAEASTLLASSLAAAERLGMAHLAGAVRALMAS